MPAPWTFRKLKGRHRWGRFEVFKPTLDYRQIQIDGNYDTEDEAAARCLELNGLKVVSSEQATDLSIRDWFAGQGLVGLLSMKGVEWRPKALADRAYVIADAMLAARNRVDTDR